MEMMLFHKLVFTLGMSLTLLLVELRLMSVHLCLKDPGPDGAVLAVQIGLPHLAHRLLCPEAKHLVWGHLHVGLALLRHLPLLVHHLLQVLQEGPW